jgi:hypothetical protein
MVVLWPRVTVLGHVIVVEREGRRWGGILMGVGQREVVEKGNIPTSNSDWNQNECTENKVSQ